MNPARILIAIGVSVGLLAVYWLIATFFFDPKNPAQSVSEASVQIAQQTQADSQSLEQQRSGTNNSVDPAAQTANDKDLASVNQTDQENTDRTDLAADTDSSLNEASKEGERVGSDENEADAVAVKKDSSLATKGDSESQETKDETFVETNETNESSESTEASIKPMDTEPDPMSYSFSYFRPTPEYDIPQNEIKEIPIETDYMYIVLTENEGAFQDVRFKNFPYYYVDEEFEKKARKWMDFSRAGESSESRAQAGVITTESFWDFIDSLKPHLGGYQGYESPINRYDPYLFRGNPYPILPLQLTFIHSNLFEQKYQKYLNENKPWRYIPYKYMGTQENEHQIQVEFQTELYDIQAPSHHVIIERTYTFHKDSYYFDVQLKFRRPNNSAAFTIESPFVESKEGEQKCAGCEGFGGFIYWPNGLGPILPTNEQTYYDTSYIYFNYGKVDGSIHYYYDASSFEGTSTLISDLHAPPQWIGLDNRYYVMAFLPDQNPGHAKISMKQAWIWLPKWRGSKMRYGNEVSTMGHLTFGYGLNPISLHQPRTAKMRMFLGPKQRDELAKTEQRDPEAGTYPSIACFWDRAAWFFITFTNWIAYLLEWVLFFLNSFIGNFAVSLIVLTVLLKLLFHPLIAKGMKANQKLRAVQPKMKALQERYKDDKQKLQKEISQLYMREKVNPMGGCLPMLVQIPIFYALWLLFPFLSELRNVHFLWIRDLSAPDTVLTIGFFPHHINILPLIMTLTSFLQTKLTPTMTGGADPTGQGAATQKIMLYVMPVMFLFIFYNMPSGMVLYWTIQNILQVGHQFYMNKKLDKEMEEKKDGGKDEDTVDMDEKGDVKSRSKKKKSNQPKEKQSLLSKAEAYKQQAEQKKKKRKTMMDRYREMYPDYALPGGKKTNKPKKNRKKRK